MPDTIRWMYHRNRSTKENIMGLLEDAKDAADATGKKVGEFIDDTRERVSDKVDEVQADAEVSRKEAELRKAEAERDATEAKNEYKEQLRD
jgi:hypothetical protein